MAALRASLKKYGKESRHNVISRKDNLILVPDKPATLQESDEQLADEDETPRADSGANIEENGADDLREFGMDDVFDYIKTGIGSIIEDEVTQRFVAEELKVGDQLLKLFRFQTAKRDTSRISELESADAHQPVLRVRQRQADRHLDPRVLCQILSPPPGPHPHPPSRGKVILKR